jgi:hypothetical protein
MDYLLAWLWLLPSGYYLISSGRSTLRELSAMGLAVMAADWLLDGGLLLGEANGRWHQDQDVAPVLGTALVELAIGSLLGLLAAWLFGWLRRAKPKYVTVSGVVTSVQPIPAGGKVHWRVGFAYFSADGIARESVDEVYVAGLQSGDSCTVVYPPEEPELGTLRSFSTPAQHPGESLNESLNRSLEQAAG